MTFIPKYRFESMLKAKRRKTPGWMDFRPSGAGSRNAYEIAAKYEGRFARSFMDAVKDTLPENPPAAFRDAWRRESIDDALGALPLIDVGTDAYKRFEVALLRAYSGVMLESGREGTKQLNELLGVNFGFSLDDGVAAEVLKDEGEEGEYGRDKDWDIDDRWLTPIVPVNPYSVRWMQTRAMELVTQGITVQQHETVRLLLEDGFARGLRIERLYPEISANIGLLPRELKAVVNRRLLHEVAGMSAEQVEKLTAKYAAQLLRKRAERIARTETINAQAAGRRQAWQLAEESGKLPEVRRRWMSAPGSDNPDRPCEICLDLDGKTAQINGQYESIKGPLDGPTAHPGCRCNEVLERVA